MSTSTFDFTAYRVLVVGGTRGTGLAIANRFAAAGAHVGVTGTLMLRELYDADLSRFEYEMVNLARQESIDNLVSSLTDIDIVVLAAGCNLPYGLPDSERAFISGAVASGMLGPMFVARRLRLKLAQSPAPGGGCVVVTGAAQRWLDLAQPNRDNLAELADMTARTAQSWTGIGARINAVVEPTDGRILPRQFARESAPTGARQSGDLLVRTQPKVHEAMADAALFLASEQASRLTGQTLRIS